MDLAKQSSFLNKNIVFLSNRPIVEYDMKDAGISLITKYKLLPKKTIQNIKKLGNGDSSLTKKEKKFKQNVVIGKLQKNDKDLATKLALAFEMERRQFIESNQLEESDIISIKKDAFFISTNKPIKGDMGDGVRFRKKNEYTSYMRIGKLEFYYARKIIKDNDILDVKGISDENLSLHEKYLCSFIKTAFRYYEEMGLSETLLMMRAFFDDYKKLKLDSGYYREFNPISKFHYTDGEKSNIDYRDNKSELVIYTNFNIIKTMILYFAK